MKNIPLFKLSLSAVFFLAHLSNTVCAVASDRSLKQFEKLEVVKHNTRKRLSLVDAHDAVSLGDVQSVAVSTSSASMSAGRRRLQNGTMAVANDDDFSNMASSTSTTTFETATAANATSSNSADETAAASSDSNETAPEVDESPTETPTLTVEELISLMDDDLIENVTSFIPAEKEQPKEWAGEVIGFFILGALVLFAATGIKQCRKRRTYSEIPTSLVV